MIKALPIYQQLYDRYGPQQWWPADTPFEMMIGAILTQNCSWLNVEKAISNLKAADILAAEEMLNASHEQLGELIRPAGFFNQKAATLQRFSRFYIDQGQLEGLKTETTAALREELLAITGIGPETADSMLLYGLERPIFVIDAYSRRIFSRLGVAEATIKYHELQQWFQQQLTAELHLFQEYHALIVQHAKAHCRAKPLCEGCPLQASCITAQQGI